MSKQTAVEWLAIYIESISSLNHDEVIEQAKAIEREQHSKTYNQGLNSNFQNFEHYYEQTYGKEAIHE